jgi:hypothetical protein
MVFANTPNRVNIQPEEIYSNDGGFSPESEFCVCIYGHRALSHCSTIKFDNRLMYVNFLRSLGHWDRGFESHLRHGCLVCIYVYSVFVLSCV